MKKIAKILIAISILLNIYVPVYAETDIVSGTFSSSSERLIESAEFVYDETEFVNDSYTYSHSIAKTSLRLAMSAFADTDSGYSKQYQNAYEFMKTMGYDSVLWNDEYTKKPTTDSIGVIAGNKKVTNNSESYTILAIAIRGGNYESEWGGNFNLGKEDLHQGFKIARDATLEFIKKYVKDNTITGNIKIWLTGYSRGAAVANLVGAYLDTNPGLFGKAVNFIPENLYTYCFGTPGCARNLSADKLYNNIFSIVNRNDFVPMIAMEEWGYGRYGKTYYLPSSETNEEYSVLEKNMLASYNKYVTDDYKITADSKKFAEYEYVLTISLLSLGISFRETDTGYYANMGEFLNATAYEMAYVFESPEKYADYGQKELMYYGDVVIGQNRLTEFIDIFRDEVIKRATPLNIVNTISNSESATVNTVMEKIARDSVLATFEKMGLDPQDGTAEVLVSFFINMLGENKLATLIGNSDILGEGHYPELCLAWLEVTDETHLTNKNGTFVIPRGITVLLNDSLIKFDQPPVIKDDRTLVPLRAIFEALGATVDWDGETQTVTSVRGDKEVKLSIGSNVLYVNSQAVELDVPAQLINDRTMVPVRAVAESFDCFVDWDGEQKTVIIEDKTVS